MQIKVWTQRAAIEKATEIWKEQEIFELQQKPIQPEQFNAITI